MVKRDVSVNGIEQHVTLFIKGLCVRESERKFSSVE